MSLPPKLVPVTCQIAQFPQPRIRRIFQILSYFTTPRTYLLLTTTSSSSAHYRSSSEAWKWRVEQILDYFSPNSNIHRWYRDNLYYNAYREYYRLHVACRVKIAQCDYTARANHHLPSLLQERIDTLCDNLVVRTIRLNRSIEYQSSSSRPLEPVPPVRDESALLHIDPAAYPMLAHHTEHRHEHETVVDTYEYDAGRVTWAFYPGQRRVDFYIDSSLPVCSYLIERSEFVENPGVLFCNAFTYDSSHVNDDDDDDDDRRHLIERDGTVVERRRTRDKNALRSDTLYVNWARVHDFRSLFAFLVDPMSGRWPWSNVFNAPVPPPPFVTDTLTQIRSSPRQMLERCHFYLMNTSPGQYIERIGRILVLHVLMTNPTLKQPLAALNERAALPQVSVQLVSSGGGDDERSQRRVFHVHIADDNIVSLDLAPFLAAMSTLRRVASGGAKRKRTNNV